MAQPNFPKTPSSSFKKYEPKTAPMSTLSAPNGVTKIAGANAYAAKLATSPSTSEQIPAHQSGVFRYANPSPSNPCLSAASFKPFFVITKLVPMASVETMASARPMYLSSSMSNMTAAAEGAAAGALVSAEEILDVPIVARREDAK